MNATKGDKRRQRIKTRPRWQLRASHRSQSVSGEVIRADSDRRRFRSQAEARMAVFDYLEGFYDPRRRHSALDYKSPIEYERTQSAAA